MLIYKINKLVLLLGLLASLIVTSVVSVREFSAELERVIETATAAVRGQPALPMLISRRDDSLLRKMLAEYLSSAAVRYVALVDASGELLLQQQRAGGVAYPLASYRNLRVEGNPMDVVTRQRSIRQLHDSRDMSRVEASGVFSALFAERLSDVTIPIVSVVSPLDSPGTPAAFTRALLERADAHSLYVVGYLNVGISHRHLWQAVRPVMGMTALACGFFLLLSLVTSWLYGRRIIGPLSDLAQLAEQVAAREIDSGVQFRASGEARHIANMLNTVIGELNTYKTHMNVNQQLLSMKVEERNAQLTERDQELNKAVDEVSRTREDLHRMAYFDSLTGLPNRRLFTEQLNLLLRLAARNNSLLALLFLDLDNFKRINDSLGHSAGDLLLREVGIRLSNSMRDSDVISHYVDDGGGIEVSRLGGDEFTVVLNLINSPEAAGLVAQRMLDAMTAPMIIDGHELVITPSIGIAIGPRDAEDVESLLKAADTAMYHAKNSGKNNYMFYSPDMKVSNVERLKMETELRRAIEREELVLHYQPLVDISSGSVVGVEALIRWQHPEYGQVPPARFIPMAEEMGLIVSIGEWTLEEACRCMEKLRREGCDIAKVAVNVSALAFSPALVGRVQHALEASGIDPGLLELELTEGVMMDSTSASVESLEKMKALGVDLSIDDFGTGYSSLSYLSHFPLDTLKIDRSFVTDFDKSDSNASLVVAIIAMATSLNLEVVAEGVETTEQLQFLSNNGVNIIQGFLFSPAVPSSELVAMLEPGHFMPQIQEISNKKYRRISGALA